MENHTYVQSDLLRNRVSGVHRLGLWLRIVRSVLYKEHYLTFFESTLPVNQSLLLRLDTVSHKPVVVKVEGVVDNRNLKTETKFSKKVTCNLSP